MNLISVSTPSLPTDIPLPRDAPRQQKKAKWKTLIFAAAVGASSMPKSTPSAAYTKAASS